MFSYGLLVLNCKQCSYVLTIYLILVILGFSSVYFDLTFHLWYRNTFFEMKPKGLESLLYLSNHSLKQ